MRPSTRWAGRASLLAVAVLGVLAALAWATMDNPIPPLRNGPPEIPKATGYCVTVDDTDGTLIGVVDVPFHKPDPAKLDEFKASLTSAVNLVGRMTNRADVIDASSRVELIDNPIPPLVRPRSPRKPTVPNGATTAQTGCAMHCACATPILCTNADLTDSLDRVVLAVMRKSPNPPGSNVCGCGGACGPCEHCVMVCPGK